jgi:hypothetical protein
MWNKRWMAVVALALIGAAACADEVDTPEKAVRRAECKQLEEHAIRISPQFRDQIAGLSDAQQQAKLAERIGRVPVEDIEQCVAADQSRVRCMLAAPDVAALRACIPAK